MSTAKKEILAIIKLVVPFILAYGFLFLTMWGFVGDFRLLESVFIFSQIAGNVIIAFLYLRQILSRMHNVAKPEIDRKSSDAIYKDTITV